METIKEIAIHYQENLGFSVIPIKSGSKVPDLQSWTQYQIAPADKGQVETWFHENFNRNIGIVCGDVSGIVVVDIDREDKDELSRLKLPPTVTVKTGNGYHAYYRKPNSLKMRSFVFSLGEVQSDGKYVVAPASIHPSGVRYEWTSEVPKTIDDLAEFTPDMLTKLQASSGSSAKQPLYKNIYRQEVEKGGRNITITSMVGKLLYNTPESDWNNQLEVVKSLNQTHNNPPLDERELLSVFNSIASREREGRRKKQNEKDLILLCKIDNKECALQVAKHIVEKHNVINIGETKPEILIYKEGVYVSGENIIKKDLQSILQKECTQHLKKEIIERVRDSTSISRKGLEQKRNLLNFANGVYDINSKTILPHDPKYMFLTKIPINFNARSVCPASEKFISEIVGKNDIDIIQEWFGYMLYRTYSFKKAIIFVGEGDTGKTTLLRLMTYFIGKENVSGISLQQIGSDKFATAHLYNKHINIYDDLSFKDINDNGSFKMLTGGGYVSGEYKFGNRFQFENYAKLTFSCNKIPSVKDTDDDAYFRRWIVVQFNKNIATKDKFLLEKLTTPEELSGLLNFALEGLYRLLSNEDFTYNKDPDEVKAEMLKSGSSVANFAYDSIEEGDSSDFITKEDMYRRFVDYTRLNKLPNVTINYFGKRLPKYAEYISDSKHGNGRTWRNVKIKEENNQ